jgi:methyl-accepting chemotaxis protein
VGFGWDIVMQTGLFREYVLDPYIYLLGDTNFLITTFGVPVKDKDDIVGYVGGSIELSTIQSISNEIKPFGDGFALVFSDTGIIAAHTDPSRLGKNIQESENDTFGPFLNTMVDAVTKGTAASFSYRPPQSETLIRYYSVPFAIGRATPPWTLVIGVSHNTIMAPLYRMVSICLIIGIIIIILMSAGVIFTARSISRPIAYTMTVLKDIAEGDLTREITVHAHNELGDLVRYLNFTVENIKNLILSIRKEADSLSQTGAELAEASEIGRNGLEEVSSDIQEIAKQSEGILEINSVMQNIASQTNLLSMNAAIEAAHAGEAGKGFAVVADEIRKLAESSSEQSKTISKVLKNIKDSIDKITKSTGGVLLKFEAISEGVRKVTDQETSVRNAMDEQGAGSKSILESISSLNEITDKVTRSAYAMGGKSREVIRESEALEVITNEISGGMQRMAAGAEQISRAVKRVDDISVENKKQIEVLIGEVSRFRVE